MVPAPHRRFARAPPLPPTAGEVVLVVSVFVRPEAALGTEAGYLHGPRELLSTSRRVRVDPHHVLGTCTVRKVATVLDRACDVCAPLREARARAAVWGQDGADVPVPALVEAEEGEDEGEGAGAEESKGSGAAGVDMEALRRAQARRAAGRELVPWRMAALAAYLNAPGTFLVSRQLVRRDALAITVTGWGVVAPRVDTSSARLPQTESGLEPLDAINDKWTSQWEKDSANAATVAQHDRVVAALAPELLRRWTVYAAWAGTVPDGETTAVEESLRGQDTGDGTDTRARVGAGAESGAGAGAAATATFAADWVPGTDFRSREPLPAMDIFAGCGGLTEVRAGAAARAVVASPEPSPRACRL